jgi:hypothetical protein
VGLKLKGTHHLLVHSCDVNFSGANVGTLKKNTEILIDASKEVGLEVNVEITKNVDVLSPECRSKLGQK